MQRRSLTGHDPPRVDLNGPEDGRDYETDYVFGQAPVPIAFCPAVLASALVTAAMS